MLEPIKSPDESARLAELYSLYLLDKSAEERFDRITRTAQRMFGVQIALITLIDSDRQWFCSKQGLDISQTPRNISFCGHTILNDVPLVVENALEDERFFDNPLVVGVPYIQFYAGYPLHGPKGYRIGTLCIADPLPRIFSIPDQVALKDIAEWAELELNTQSLAQAVNNFKESESQLRLIVDNVIDAIITMDDAGVILNVNQAGIKIFGYTSDELVEKNIKVLIPELYRGDCEKCLQSYRESEQTKAVEVGRKIIGQRKDGSNFPMDIAVNPIWLNGRKCFTAIIRDLSEYKRTAEKIHESMSLMQAVMDSTSSLVFVRDIAGCFLYMNKQMTNVYKINSKEWIGKSTREIFSPEQAEIFEKSDQHVIANRQTMRIEIQIEHEDGPHTYYSVKSPLFNEHGDIYGVCVVSTDITQRKEVEDDMLMLNEKLIEKTAFLHAILNGTTASIISTDVDGTIRLFNHGAERMLGYSADEMIGKQTPNILHVSMEVVARAAQLNVELGHTVMPGFEVFVAKPKMGIVDENEWTYLRKDGTSFPVMLSVSALRNEENVLTGFLGFAYDLTERKKIETMKNEFISTVSHELRTPLTSIRGSLGLLVSGAVGEIPSRAKTLLDIANNNCDRLVRLINDILDVEKIESGSMRYEMLLQPILPLVEQSIAATQSYAEKFHVKLMLQPNAQDGMVLVDADRLTQVLVNLLSNAAKFSEVGTTVRIQIRRFDHRIRFSVIDHGPGISDGFKERIFHKFQQADSSDTRKKEGTGLGLNISKAIIEKHGGIIDFTSQVGVGTEFYFELPLAEFEKTTEHIKNNKVRILICENDLDVGLCESTIVRAGLDVDVVKDAEQAKQLLAAHIYQIMIIDIAFSNGEGSSLLQWMRLHDGQWNFPIIMVSAKIEECQQITEGIVGVVDWIAKPIEEVALRSILTRYIPFSFARRPKVLHVEDDADVVKFVATLLENEFEVEQAPTLVDAINRLNNESYILILLDLGLPDGDGIGLLGDLPAVNATTPIVIFSGNEVGERDVGRAAAALVKSRTTNEKLVDTIHQLIIPLCQAD